MTRRRWILLALPLAVFAVWALWWTGNRVLGTAPAREDTERTSYRRTANGRDLAEAIAAGRNRSAKLPWSNAVAPDHGSVTIMGTVLDARSASPVGGVEVVFRNEAGEETTTANADGTYSLELPVGAYRAFVRDDAVLSVGRNDRIRLPGAPTADIVNAPDDALMPIIVAYADARGIDLSVMRAGTLRGRVVDGSGRPVAKAMLRAHEQRAGVRPALGTDVAETDSDGRYEMRLPEGMFALAAHHPRYAGASEQLTLRVQAGQTIESDLTLAAGCVISGRVIAANGQPSGDGALERQWGGGSLQFGPDGRVESDGSFRWTSVEAGPVVLRAWPWKSPPSPERSFDCKDGARFDNVVFQLPDAPPDIEGVLVDATGAPVAFAYVDLTPLSVGGIGQQERTDAEGKWAVYRMPAGRYRVNATAPGRGAVSREIGSPEAGVRLQLSGTGRIEGTTTQLANGSIEVRMQTCTVDGHLVPIAQDTRIVSVTGGRFTIDNAPACQLELAITWRDQLTPVEVAVTANGTAQVEAAIGPPRKKTVSGIVRDATGNPVGSVTISARHGTQLATAVSDASGRYTIETFSGATLLAVGGLRESGVADVGMANVDREQVDLVIVQHEDDHDDLMMDRDDEP